MGYGAVFAGDGGGDGELLWEKMLSGQWHFAGEEDFSSSKRFTSGEVCGIIYR